VPSGNLSDIYVEYNIHNGLANEIIRHINCCCWRAYIEIYNDCSLLRTVAVEVLQIPFACQGSGATVHERANRRKRRGAKFEPTVEGLGNAG
jgi:hypothetical protein